MENVDKIATVGAAHGVTLDKPFDVPYNYEAYGKTDVVPESEYSQDDLRTWVNARRNANARAEAVNKALAEKGIVKPTLKDPDTALASIVKALVAQGFTEDNAKAAAANMLGSK